MKIDFGKIVNGGLGMVLGTGVLAFVKIYSGLIDDWLTVLVIGLTIGLIYCMWLIYVIKKREYVKPVVWIVLGELVKRIQSDFGKDKLEKESKSFLLVSTERMGAFVASFVAKELGLSQVFMPIREDVSDRKSLISDNAKIERKFLKDVQVIIVKYVCDSGINVDSFYDQYWPNEELREPKIYSLFIAESCKSVRKSVIGLREMELQKSLKLVKWGKGTR